MAEEDSEKGDNGDPSAKKYVKGLMELINEKSNGEEKVEFDA